MTMSILASVMLATALAMPAVQQPLPAAGEAASPELLSMLTKELGVTQAQAAGGAGALLGLAKTRLKPADFATVSAAVPGTDALIKSAPVASVGGVALPSSASSAAGLAGLAGTFSKLGLTADSAAKFVPVLLKFVNGKGATQAATLLAGALK